MTGTPPTPNTGHVPVLLDEVLRLLAPQPGEVAVDATAGRGGHSLALARSVEAGPSGGRLLICDLDQANLTFAAQRIEDAGFACDQIHDSFIRLPHHLTQAGLSADVLLADLGFSSTQMDDPARGFSFQADGPLDMRLNPRSPITAANLLATLNESELADVIFRYGEDPYARRIARKLAQTSRIKPIQTTAELASLVTEAYGPRARHSRMHPATRTFMALRIAVNDELGALDALLEQIVRAARDIREHKQTWLAPGARVAIIAFHSLEDRLIKRAFAGLADDGLAERLTRRVIKASEQEQRTNPRARSARLRVVRIDDAR